MLDALRKLLGLGGAAPHIGGHKQTPVAPRGLQEVLGLGDMQPAPYTPPKPHLDSQSPIGGLGSAGSYNNVYFGTPGQPYAPPVHMPELLGQPDWSAYPADSPSRVPVDSSFVPDGAFSPRAQLLQPGITRPQWYSEDDGGPLNVPRFKA